MIPLHRDRPRPGRRRWRPGPPRPENGSACCAITMIIRALITFSDGCPGYTYGLMAVTTVRTRSVRGGAACVELRAGLARLAVPQRRPPDAILNSSTSFVGWARVLLATH